MAMAAPSLAVLILVAAFCCTSSAIRSSINLNLEEEGASGVDYNPQFYSKLTQIFTGDNGNVTAYSFVWYDATNYRLKVDDGCIQLTNKSFRCRDTYYIFWHPQQSKGEFYALEHGECARVGLESNYAWIDAGVPSSGSFVGNQVLRGQNVAHWRFEVKNISSTYDSYVSTATTLPVYVHASMFFGIYQNYCFLDDTKTGPSAVPDSVFTLPPICKRSPLVTKTSLALRQQQQAQRDSSRMVREKVDPVPFPALDSCFGWPFVAPGL